ncbi:terminase large subunit [Olsenella sp. Marseille-P4559]|uniref:terminase large subunit n=1 Tax=Olsenella sp. Marseille-P4559 TaxID=2364795 RepID=UPI001030213B|nr:terminase TerL endonuclease subunit [Olsenella sp. Marseille-P4559]
MRSYFGGIQDGTITACRKMKQVAEIVLRDIDNKDPLYPYHFREEYAAKHVGFIERFCRLPSGKLGHAFNLEPFQLAILSVIFGFVDAEGLRQYREVLWIMGRKNGKTVLASAIELDLLINDDEGAPEIYNVATAYDQAAKGFNNALRMVKTSPALAKHVRKRVADLYCNLNMGVIRALAANTNYLDGLDVSGAIIDELGAMRNRDLYDLTIQGMSARRQPLVLEITTNGFVRAGIFDAQYKYAANWLDGKATGVDTEHFIAFIFELDDREEWQDEAAWSKANPGLGQIKSLAALRKNVAKAKNDPTFLPTLLVKDFNLIENQSQAWLTWSEIHNEATFDPSDGFKYGILGVDASDTTDLTAACMLMKRPNDPNIYAMHMAWIPERALEQAEREGRRGGRDGVPYDAWIANGYLRTCATPIIDKRVVLDWVQEIQDKYGIYAAACGYDPWHMRDVPTVEAYEGYFGADYFRRVVQGAQTLSMPMKELRALYRENRIVDNANPIAEWCRSNVAVRSDANGNIAPDKKNQDPRNRIDVWAAECDAFVVLKDMADEYQSMIGG